MTTFPFLPELKFHFDYIDLLWIFRTLVSEAGARIFSPGSNLLHVIATFTSRGFLPEPRLKSQPQLKFGMLSPPLNCFLFCFFAYNKFMTVLVSKNSHLVTMEILFAFFPTFKVHSKIGLFRSFCLIIAFAKFGRDPLSIIFLIFLFLAG